MVARVQRRGRLEGEVGGGVGRALRVVLERVRERERGLLELHLLGRPARDLAGDRDRLAERHDRRRGGDRHVARGRCAHGRRGELRVRARRRAARRSSRRGGSGTVVDAVSPVSVRGDRLARVAAGVPVGDCDPYSVVVPYSKRYVVRSLFADTVPPIVAVVAVHARSRRRSSRSARRPARSRWRRGRRSPCRSQQGQSVSQNLSLGLYLSNARAARRLGARTRRGATRRPGSS